MATKQLVMELDKKPEPIPAQDLLAQIRQEHEKAELLRLSMGQEGCGCSDCQELYRTLDLSKYGERVKRSGDFIVIVAGKTGADLLESTDHWDNTGQVFFSRGRGFSLDGELKTVDIGSESDIVQALATGEIADDLCPDRAEVLSDILDRKEGKDDGEQPELHRPGAFRSRVAGKAKRGATHTKSASFRKRLPSN